MSQWFTLLDDSLPFIFYRLYIVASVVVVQTCSPRGLLGKLILNFAILMVIMVLSFTDFTAMMFW